MAANLPEITYRYPTLQNDASSELRPSIIFDWSADMETTQFSDNASRATNVLLIDEATSTLLATDFVSYTAASRRVTIQPSSNLEANKSYRVLVKSKLASTDGRKSFNEYHWTFMTASGVVSEIALLAPGNSTVQAIAPTLYWNAVTYVSSASAYTVNYLLELSNRSGFDTISYSTTTTETSALPNYTSFITDNTTYYWRVLPYTTVATGFWSDVWSFYYGRTLLETDPTTRQFLPESDPFGVKKLGFKNGASNLSTFPTTLSVNFTAIPASDYANYLEVKRKYVLPRNDIATTYDEVDVSGSWALSGSTLTFSPSDSIVDNCRYEIRLLSDMKSQGQLELGEDYSFWFTSKYTPFYVSPRVIRARFLGAEQRVPDDLINFYIHQCSLEANARYWGYGNQSYITAGDSLLETTVRDASNLVSYGVLKWVEAAAAYMILKAILFEHLRDIGRTERLGDSVVALTADFIKGIDKAIALVKEELDQWEDYLAPSDIPVTVPKSFGWSPLQWDYDSSIMDLESQRDDGFEFGAY